jgi:hypothetical protein
MALELKLDGHCGRYSMKVSQRPSRKRVAAAAAAAAAAGCLRAWR